jgi:hypothetical protein
MSRLSLVTKGVKKDPIRMFLYGDEGVGKTTLAAHADEPIFFDCEQGSGHVHTSRYPFEVGDAPRDMAEVYEAIKDLQENDHSYRTLVIDSADAIEPLIWHEVVNRYSGKRSAVNKNGRRLDVIEDIAYQAGYKAAVDDWRTLASHLERLRLARGMHIIFLGHAVIRTFKNPEGEDYDRWNPRIHERAAGYLKEWADVVGFCSYEEGGHRLDEDAKRAKGYSTGRRMLHLRRTAAYDAKSRIPTPDQVEMSLDDPWGPFARAIEAGRDMTPTMLIDLIALECARLDNPGLTEKVQAAVKTHRENPSVLLRYLNELKNRQPQTTEENDA